MFLNISQKTCLPDISVESFFHARPLSICRFFRGLKNSIHNFIMFFPLSIHPGKNKKKAAGDKLRLKNVKIYTLLFPDLYNYVIVLISALLKVSLTGRSAQSDQTFLHLSSLLSSSSADNSPRLP